MRGFVTNFNGSVFGTTQHQEEDGEPTGTVNGPLLIERPIAQLVLLGAAPTGTTCTFQVTGRR